MCQITPLIRHGLLGTQPEIGGQHFIRLTRNGLADSVRQETDSGKRTDRERYGGKQYQHFA
jgi:hypothetical protein